MNIDQLYFPHTSVTRRLRYLNYLLSLAVLASVTISWRLWTSERVFPMAPVFENLQIINPFLNKIIFAFFLLLPICILIARKPTVFIIAFLFISVFLVIYDQNRIQPWLYQYFIMFFLLSFYNWRVDEPKIYIPIFNALRCCIVFVIMWCGIHKLNANFVQKSWPLMISSLDVFFSPAKIKLFQKLGYLLPIIEIIGAVALFLPNLKRIAIPLLIFTQFVMLILIGPLGQNQNQVLWPWNCFMIICIYILFAGKTDTKFSSLFNVFQFQPAYIAFFLLGIFPALNLVNKWDSFLSNNFYPNNASNANIELSNNAIKKLPNYLKSFTTTDNNKQILHLDSWAMFELGAPNYPEKRVYAVVTSYVKNIICSEEDVNLKFKEKPTIFAKK